MSEGAAGTTRLPEWLETLLSTRFFLACGAHPASPRNECNMFCLDCPSPSPPFCYYCRSHRHQSHRVIQIRRSSYHDVVRVTEVEDVLDISGVQTYVINSAKLVDTKTGGRGATVQPGDATNDDAAAAGGSSKNGGARPQGRRRKGIPQRAPFGS
ncbi:hypothetical protein OsJ_28284 [Oryza sativa Japonica Group]|uniref:Uncharacterized protein n=1 Tax=Oryza sativa subsp. japonica TaxID=39947 RepID=B9FYK2_ORYSJ|nr:hypothetical protein OsJ_28284 [Oryza sativa Japonica Group]